MEVLHGINLEINKGEIAVIIGPNGSGKTTVLKSIFGLCDVYSGKIMFESKDITKLPTYRLIREGIGYVPQIKRIFPSLTVKENLEIGAFIIHDKRLIRKKITSIFDKFPFLQEKQNECAWELSGGQQQILAISRALIQDPKLLLLDEPSMGLAPKVIKEIFKNILEISKEGISVIIVEQNARQATKIADKTYVLENGEIVLEGGPEILKNAKIKDIYLGENVPL